jgi:glutamate racemase
MSSRPVAFLDSGIGGIPYLQALRGTAPRDAYVYVADTAHFPYGERSTDEVRSIVIDRVSEMISLFSPRCIVLACNTASVVALAALRERFDVPFVGVVPAVKPAAERTPGEPFAVLATQRTVDDPYVARLVRDYAPDARVELVPAGGLVELIEDRLGSLTPDDVGEVIAPAVARIRAIGVRSVVLGCTHFIHVREQIEAALGPGIEVIDSVAGVTRQVLRVAGGSHVEADPQAGRLLVTGPAALQSYTYLAERYGLELGELYARNSSHR